VTALRSFIEQSGGDFSAKMAGELESVVSVLSLRAETLLALHLWKNADQRRPFRSG
jgi:hypothetical protein